MREQTGLALSWLLAKASLGKSRFYDWRKRYGKLNEHNGKIPRDNWLLANETEKIVNWYKEHPFDGYRRCCYMMMDADVVAVSPATVYRVLSKAGMLNNRNVRPSRKGTGFTQPLKAHAHWHIDISYINCGGTFYYLCTVLDGFSRLIVHYELKEQMKEADVELILQRAREKYPDAAPRIISDNGPQFIARDFKEFIRLTGMTHVRTSPYYPQSNGKLERYHKSLKTECIRPRSAETQDEARRNIDEYVTYYNTIRLHSSLGFITPGQMLDGKQKEIFEEREMKLSKAREERRIKRSKIRELTN
ncbi:IS3 family transposase [Verrucomicrobia bacterium S94]|nr:IS3 family transposase [Verrucomicrobia bacterium S94]QBG49306.1 IS3 family transposase [Verrucomicrobia bacterium S94]QBG49328.1 IS3 family transposase [Verrucomicrobia bacterium S94]